MTLPRAGARSWPFAVGLILAGEDPPDGEGRLAVAVAAYYAGYYLIDVVELDARTGVTADDVSRIRALALRIDAEAIFTLGLESGALALLEAVADELRLSLRAAPQDEPGQERPPVEHLG